MLEKIIKYWLISLGLLFIIFILFSILFKYDKYLNYQGLVIKSDKEFYIKIFADINEVSNLIDRDFYINNSKQKYEIVSISDGVYVESNIKYKEIFIKTYIDEKLKIENNIINISFKLDKTSLMNTIIQYVKGAVM